MSKILVTGGCGYIGSHTIVDLIEKVVTNPDNEQVIAEVRKQVNDFMKDFPLY